MVPRWGFNLSATEVSRNDAHNLRLRFESAILAVMSSAEEPFEPYPQIDCIDCGGRDLVLPEDEEFPDF